MKILVISHMYPSNYSKVSGIFVHQQVKELVNQGCKVKVVSPVPWVQFPLNLMNPKWQAYFLIPNKDEVDGIEVYYPRYIEFPKNFLFLYSGFRMYVGIRTIVNQIYSKFPFDIIHSNTVIPDGYAGMLLAKEFRRPLVVTIHGQDFNRTIFQGFLYRLMIKQVLRFSANVIMVSNKIKRVGDKFFPKLNKKFLVINNGIDPEKIFIGKSRLTNLYQGKKIILSVSHLVAPKGIDINIKAIRRVIEKYPNLLYLIIGEGVEKKSLVKLVEKMKVTNYVEFIGQKPNEKVMEYMSICDIFSLPSWQEGFGIVYLEAMAHGKPVIACQGEGIEDVIKNGDVGLLVKPKDVKDLVKAIDFLLSNPIKANEIGKRAKKTVLGNYTWEKNVERTIKVYEDVLKRCSRSVLGVVT